MLLAALDRPASYVPIDVSAEQLADTAHELAAALPGLDVAPIVADYTQPLELPPAAPGTGRTCVFFPGSTIGNFEPDDARAFLVRLGELAGPGAALVLGADSNTDAEALLRAYDDPHGVTAAFDLNVLAHLNHSHGATFDLSAFLHRAVWNAARSRVEMHLVSRPPDGGMTATATRTALLMAALIALLAIGGWAFAGSRGLVAMALVGLAINFAAYWFSDRIALLANRAQPVSRDQAPALYAIVESLTTRAGMPMPSIHLIPSPSPNAFATGRGPDHAAVAVTEGLLRVVDRRELTGVLAHELSHVRNRDVLVATVAAGIAGVISTIGYALQFGSSACCSATSSARIAAARRSRC
jgi:hypothetical protein